jgi:hypothetical protein
LCVYKTLDQLTGAERERERDAQAAHTLDYKVNKSWDIIGHLNANGTPPSALVVVYDGEKTILFLISSDTIDPASETRTVTTPTTTPTAYRQQRWPGSDRAGDIHALNCHGNGLGSRRSLATADREKYTDGKKGPWKLIHIRYLPYII